MYDLPVVRKSESLINIFIVYYLTPNEASRVIVRLRVVTICCVPPPSHWITMLNTYMC